MIHVFGGSGRLGQSILAACGETGAAAPDTVARGSNPALRQQGLEAYFCDSARSGDIVVIASGATNPAQSPDALLAANLDLPVSIIRAAAEHGLRTLSIGSISEHFAPAANGYTDSKRRLAAWMETEVRHRGLDGLHVRLQTLYGVGEPHPHMFLGQILVSLRASIPFRMSSGRQLREYHHYDDVALALLAAARAPLTGTLDLSSGDPVRLVDLAIAIFAGCGHLELLQIGALADPVEDNYAPAWTRTDMLGPIPFRPAVPACLSYVRLRLDDKEPGSPS